MLSSPTRTLVQRLQTLPLPAFRHARQYPTSPRTRQHVIPPRVPPPAPAPPVVQRPLPSGAAAAQGIPVSNTTSLSIGLVSGTFGAMCGVGGAVFAIPALVRFAGVSQRVAAGNSLVAVTTIAVTSAASFAGAGHIDWPVAIMLGASASALTPLGAYCGRFADPALLRKGLGAFMLVLAPIMPLRQYLERGRSETAEIEALEASDPNANKKKVALVGLGSAVGFNSGLLGISGGSLFTPLIAVTHPEAPFRLVLGTSFAAMIVPTAIGAASYYRMGLVSPRIVPPLVVGAVAGASIGSAVALTIPEEVLRWGFAFVFAVLGMRVLRAPIRAPRSGAKAASPTSATEAARKTGASE